VAQAWWLATIVMCALFAGCLGGAIHPCDAASNGIPGANKLVVHVSLADAPQSLQPDWSLSSIRVVFDDVGNGTPTSVGGTFSAAGCFAAVDAGPGSARLSIQVPVVGTVGGFWSLDKRVNVTRGTTSLELTLPFQSWSGCIDWCVTAKTVVASALPPRALAPFNATLNLSSPEGSNVSWVVEVACARYGECDMQAVQPPVQRGTALPAQVRLRFGLPGHYLVSAREACGGCAPNPTNQRLIVDALWDQMDARGAWTASNRVAPVAGGGAYPVPSRGWQLNATWGFSNRTSWWSDLPDAFEGTLTSAAFQLSADGMPHALSFRVNGSMPASASFSVAAVGSAGSVAWSPPVAHVAGWEQVHLGLGALNGTVRVQARFSHPGFCAAEGCGSTKGWFLDDVEVG